MQLTRTHRILIGVVVAGALVIAGIGFAGSYAAVRDLAQKKGFGDFANVFPIGIDAGICVLLALDLLLTWMRIPFPLLRQTAWLLTAATIAFNGAAAWPDPLGVGMHAVIPVLFVVSVEAARHAVGRIADITADRHMESVRVARWLLAPVPTFRLWRRMKLWELRSYDEVIKFEQDRLVYRARLRARYGRAWRRKAPVESVMPLRLARYGVPLADTAEAGLAAAGIEPAVIRPALTAGAGTTAGAGAGGARPGGSDAGGAAAAGATTLGQGVAGAYATVPDSAVLHAAAPATAGQVAPGGFPGVAGQVSAPGGFPGVAGRSAGPSAGPNGFPAGAEQTPVNGFPTVVGQVGGAAPTPAPVPAPAPKSLPVSVPLPVYQQAGPDEAYAVAQPHPEPRAEFAQGDAVRPHAPQAGVERAADLPRVEEAQSEAPEFEPEAEGIAEAGAPRAAARGRLPEDMPRDEALYGAFRQYCRQNGKFPSAFQFGQLLRDGYGLTGLDNEELKAHVEEFKGRYRIEQEPETIP
ncbi:DUF2637 domain-containing protein [Streptomyces sp. LX-29]|uniref:DUF2637 domain-containing protein n=1 Tax=Streptomyces sp. LX-29 TaxID=2900152 RepID=UPI00240DF06C|nr:DUF2637 domain-containing protein [Streptomyces sp. LX-29]WFB08071.1 DUF2637 domain-containing protein [Streptomyces sp. LX-29]